MTKEIKFFGFDPGTVKAGWGVVDDSLFHYGSGIFEAEKKLSVSRRLAKIHDELSYRLVQERPDVLVVEKAYLSGAPQRRNVVTAIRLGEARGLALVLGGRMGIPVVELDHQVVKKTVTGRGNISKEGVLQMVAGQLRLDPGKLTLDQSDALGLALAAALRMRTLKKFLSGSVETIRGLERALKKLGDKTLLELARGGDHE